MITFKVGVTAIGFSPTSGVSRRSELGFTDTDLAWALFTTGRAPGDEALHGFASVAEFVHRAALIPAYVRRDARHRLIRSSLATDLDRSEKVNLSYSLGQAMAGVFAQQQLGVVRLMHVDRYAPGHKVKFGPSKQRPDLFGPGKSGWVVIEAKGRSNAMESDLAKKVKSQASNVTSIAGSKPWVALGSVAQFRPPNRLMTLQAIDPEPVEGGMEWDIDLDDFVAAYYAPFLRVLDVGQAFSAEDYPDNRIQAVDLGAVGVRVGLARDLVGLLRERQGAPTTGLAEQVDALLVELSETRGDLRPDGSWFDTSWEAALARQDGEG